MRFRLYITVGKLRLYTTKEEDGARYRRDRLRLIGLLVIVLLVVLIVYFVRRA